MSLWSDVLTRHKAVPVLTVVLVAILGTAAVGQISHIASGQRDGPDYPAPYDASKPDQELKAFDKSHPKCALWTDWHKLCSRTGPGGSTYCRIDQLHPVKPSTPFCAKDYSSPAKPDTHAELLSRRRFSNLEGSSIPSQTNSKSPNYRIRYKDRPFSGSTIYEMEHPYCAVWIYENGVAPAFCAEDGRKGMPSCSEPKVKFTPTTRSSFFPACYEAVKGRACDPEATISPDRPAGEDFFGNPYDETMVSAFHPNVFQPVAGHYCPIEEQK
ncbi:hypothetical protein [Sphingomonas pruni]|uniref:hypothetical protein n=1 Tax=Sphingomonas pruni TaxID=40683 RepID=UPI000AB373CA|nr:hypothetical protein [Sphingomonas pruni]